jgi:tRNA dimethylallyltransferase
MPEVNSKPFLIVITGPTAIGKSAVSLKVAAHFSTEIISADSRQLYREMSIGTAVPTSAELQEIPHHFVHSHSIHDYYNASRFEEEVLQKLDDLFHRHSAVVLAGGSMLYVDAVCNGIDDLPEIDMEIRNYLTELYATEGIESLRLMLKKADPLYYAEVDLQNHKRLLHALEICLITGKPYSGFRKQERKSRPFNLIKIGLTADREVIYNRINQRVDQMVADGLEEEARSLFPHRSTNALNTVGYREWFDHFEGLMTKAETIDKIKSNTRRYARKQLTWFKRDRMIKWFDIRQTDQIIPYLNSLTIDKWNRTDNL